MLEQLDIKKVKSAAKVPIRKANTIKSKNNVPQGPLRKTNRDGAGKWLSQKLSPSPPWVQLKKTEKKNKVHKNLSQDFTQDSLKKRREVKEDGGKKAKKPLKATSSNLDLNNKHVIALFNNKYGQKTNPLDRNSCYVSSVLNFLLSNSDVVYAIRTSKEGNDKTLDYLRQYINRDQ